MKMAIAGLEPEKETRCEPVASRRCTPDLAKVGEGELEAPKRPARGLVVGDVGK